MKNNNLLALKKAIYMMKFESFGEIKQAGEAVQSIDKAMQGIYIKQGKIFEDAGVEAKDGQYQLGDGDSRIPVVNKGISELMDAESGVEIAFLTEDQFNNAIKVKEVIPTELLILAGKYLVK